MTPMAFIASGGLVAAATVLHSPPGIGAGMVIGVGIGLMIAGLALWLAERHTAMRRGE